MSIRIGIIGAKGYTAGEALRWLAGHPEFEVACLMARVDAPEPVENYFPALRGVFETKIEPMNVEALADRCDAVMLALPHTTAQEYAPGLIEAGLKVVDLSADFRFDVVETYEATYGVKHLAPQLAGKLPYALPELFGEEIPGAPGLSGPGCYPTGALLALAPLMSETDDFDLDAIVVNSLSGASGAGRKPLDATMFCEVNESVKAYGVASHRHRPEIEEKLSKLAGRPIRTVFTPHLVPITRGLLTTAAVRLKKPTTSESAHALFGRFYDGRPFVRVLPPGETPSTGAVAFTNFCDVGVKVDEHNETLIVVSAIDNLGKGASSQAIQAMNLLYGLPETTGLMNGK